MLYWLLVPLQSRISFFRVFRFITVRTALAGVTALVLSLILGPWLIRMLKKYQIGQEIRSDGPQSHYAKKGTPTMGGVLIIGATLITTLLWGNLEDPYVGIAMTAMFFFGLIGFLDDYLKVRKKRSLGLRVFTKLGLQVLLACALGGVLVYLGLHNFGPVKKFDLRLFPPFFKLWTPYLGWLYLPHYSGSDLPADPSEWVIGNGSRLAEVNYLPPVLERLVLVSDGVFSAVVDDQLEVRTSVSISPMTGAAESGALFTAEAIPRACILFFPVTFLDPKFFRVPVKAGAPAE
ncbi:MAG: hypothetical protein ABSA30_13070, partial [Candidatus Aminicenantales bacterium]